MAGYCPDHGQRVIEINKTLTDLRVDVTRTQGEVIGLQKGVEEMKTQFEQMTTSLDTIKETMTKVSWTWTLFSFIGGSVVTGAIALIGLIYSNKELVAKMLNSL